MKIKNKYLIYTDGGYHLYKNEGAYAFIILQDEKIVHKNSRIVRNETNNRAELRAILDAVCWCPDESDITVRSDSQYAINTLNKTWQRRKNKDIFEEWDKIVAFKKVSVTLEWVRGHNGNKYNEMCDKMCDEAVGYDLNSWIPKK